MLDFVENSSTKGIRSGFFREENRGRPLREVRILNKHHAIVPEM